MNVKYLGFALGSVAAVTVACGSTETSNGGSGGEAGTNATSSKATGATKAAGPGATTATNATVTAASSTSTGGDNNNTIDMATAMEKDANGIYTATDDLEPPDSDLDFFKFTVDAPGPVLIYVRRADFQTDLLEDDIDPYITLYDTAKAEYAVNDDRYPRSDKQSEILTYLPAAGEYYINAQEWCTSPTKDPMACDAAYFDGLQNRDYSVIVVPMKAGMDYDAEAAEPNNTAVGATTVTNSPVPNMAGNYFLATPLANFQQAGDEDWFSVTVPNDLALDPNQRANLGFLFPWGGIDGNGSRAKIGVVEVVDAGTMGLLARLDFTNEPKNAIGDRADFNVPVTKGGTYLVKVKDGGMESNGQGNFYFGYRSIGGGNPIEAQEAANNMAATAEILMSNPVAGGFAYFVEGEIAAGDTDHFRVAVQGKPQVSVACGAQREGSGLRMLTAQVLQVDGTTNVGAAQTETNTASLFVDAVAIPAGQTDLLVRLTATQDPTVTGTFFRCGIRVHDAAM